MGMLAAWSILNKVARPQAAEYSDTVLIVCPNVTIRDRLGELRPELDAASLYRARELVPAHRMAELRQGDVIVTNWHVLERRQVADVNGQSAKVVKRGTPAVSYTHLCPGFIFEAQLLEARTGRVVFMLRGLAGERQCFLPEPVGQVRDLGWHPGEGGRIPLGLGAEIAPEPFQRIRNRARRTAAQNLADVLDGRAASLFKDRNRGAFDLPVGNVRGALAGRAIGGGVGHDEILSLRVCNKLTYY